MDLLVFDQYEQFVASVGTQESGAVVISDVWDELLGTLQLDLAETSDARVRASVGMFVAFHDLDGDVQMFEVRDRQLIKDGQTMQITRVFAEHVRYEMINDPIEDKRVYGQNARAALEVALNGTRWRIGQIVETPNGSTNFYYESALSAITKIQDVWGLRLRFRIVLTGNVITDRVVDMLPYMGRETGKRFEYGKDITGIRQTVSLSTTVTALYGRGKAEQVSENGYGRKITFADAVWSQEDGDPTDKPAGQEWVGDDDALVQWSRGGRHRFGFAEFNEIEDPLELLQATWGELQKRITPKVSYEMTVIDLERIAGYSHEAVRLWDRVRVIDKTFTPPLYVEAEVIGIQRSMAAPQNTKLMLGNYAPSIIGANARTQINLARMVDKAGAYDRGIWQSVMDVMSTQIISSGTNFFTSTEDGSYNWISDDGKSIVKITGGGVLISNEKVGDDWNWRTAITSGHMVIDEQTVGQINAALIKIMGSKGTFWDNNYIQITNQEEPLKIMRFGLYDGENSGLAFSHDGGDTWEQAVNFDGIQYAEMFQLMLNGYIKLGGIEMDGGDHPYFKFTQDGIETLIISEGAMEINQVLMANGPVYFADLPTTTNPPNLWIDPVHKKLYRTTWTPSTGGGTDPDPGGGSSNMIIVVKSTHTSASVGDFITWTAEATNNNGAVSGWRSQVIDPNGVAVTGNTGTTIIADVTIAGTWYAIFYATDADGEASGMGGNVAVTSSGGGSGTSYAGTITGNGVNFRKYANSDSDRVYPYSFNSGQRLATRSPYRAIAGSGGNGWWWPVTYTSSEPEEYYGYVSDQFFSPD